MGWGWEGTKRERGEKETRRETLIPSRESNLLCSALLHSTSLPSSSCDRAHAPSARREEREGWSGEREKKRESREQRAESPRREEEWREIAGGVIFDE
jgi:hypothetical protein